jgi:hypothetical protein
MVCRSIGEPFWRTFNVIGRQMMTIPMSILFAMEYAVMQLLDPVVQGGGALAKSALGARSRSFILTYRGQLRSLHIAVSLGCDTSI